MFLKFQTLELKEKSVAEDPLIPRNNMYYYYLRLIIIRLQHIVTVLLPVMRLAVFLKATI